MEAGELPFSEASGPNLCGLLTLVVSWRLRSRSGWVMHPGRASLFKWVSFILCDPFVVATEQLKAKVLQGRANL